MSMIGAESTSLGEMAYRQIEEMIVTRALRPGVMISEKQLCTELGVGRTPIREALQRLKLEGYVEIVPSRGAMVAPVDIMAQLDLLEVRRPLEELAVRRGSQRATPSQREHIRKIVERLEACATADDRPGYLEANRALQEAMQTSAHNTLLANTMRVIHGLSRRFWYATLATGDNLRRAAHLHGRTMLALADGDADLAAKSAAEFLDFLEALTREALERRTAPQ